MRSVEGGRPLEVNNAAALIVESRTEAVGP